MNHSFSIFERWMKKLEEAGSKSIKDSGSNLRISRRMLWTLMAVLVIRAVLSPLTLLSITATICEIVLLNAIIFLNMRSSLGMGRALGRLEAVDSLRETITESKEEALVV